MGDIASGEGRRPDKREGSKKLPGWREEGLLVEWDKVDELLDVFRRSWCCPVLNWTSNGEDGCDPRLGEEAGPLTEGEEGLPVVRFVDNVRLRGPGIMGLCSNEGDGEVTEGDCTADPALFCGNNASARSFCMTSLLAFSSTGRFL